MRVAASSPASDNMTELNDREAARNAGASAGSSSDCGTDLFLGCFFDGTRNHRLNSLRRQDKTESNISRLFDVFDRDQGSNSDKRATRFASYIQGVGTEALKEVGDTGTGWHARA
ncbi:DUF2235 domain-containing protein, partial [Stenotrophomonas maltophilia]